jgi:vancomycin resistance protein YoaR
MKPLVAVFLSLVALTFGTALAGPSAVFEAQEWVLENGEIKTYSTSKTFSISGANQLSGLVRRLSRGPSPARWVYRNKEVGWAAVENPGYAFDMAAVQRAYQGALEEGAAQFTLPVVYVEAQQGTSYYRQLGIRQMISEATTRFWGSSRERIHNIGVGAARLNGVMIAPGQTFSFARAMGEVSERTGFKSAFVIVGDKTEKGVGGGMCQVSTTLFRSAYFAGMPIVDRAPHSYQVAYYRPTGLDATVYLPYRDFKFKNDSPGYIMIQTAVWGSNLTFRFFGTKDRSTNWSNPYIANRIPAPRTRYIVDPTMRRQTFKQVDFSADGARVTVNRSVRYYNGLKRNEVLTSTYRPWGAVWLVGPGTRLKSGRVLYTNNDDAIGNPYAQPATRTAQR